LATLREKVTRNIGILRRELTGKGSGSLVESVVEEAALLHQGDQHLERLLVKVVEAKRDEEDAIRFYEKLNSEMATVFPPGTLPYDRIKAIFDDENKHYGWLIEIQGVIENRLRELR